MNTSLRQINIDRKYNSFKRIQGDSTSYHMILNATYALVFLGLVMVLSSSAVESIRQGKSSYGVFLKQSLWGIIGLIFMHICSKIPKDFYKKMAWPIIWIAICGVISVQIFGYEVNGNKNWINVGPLSGQPSEFAKFALSLWLPMILSLKHKYLSDYQVVSWPIIPIAGTILFFVWYGRDMGTVLIILFIILSSIFIAGAPMRMITKSATILIIVALLAVLLDPNRLTRILTWSNSSLCNDVDIKAMCWQPKAALYGLASGGWFGLGLGSSREKWSWLPEAHNDYIFAIVGEELGLIGTLTIMSLFCILGFAFMRIASIHRDPYIRIATGTVMFWILGQALVNMGMVMGSLPVIGIPLPLISAGGTALLFTLMAIGMILSFARTEAKKGDEKNTRQFAYRGINKSIPNKLHE